MLPRPREGPGGLVAEGGLDVQEFMRLVSTIVGSAALVGGVYALIVMRGDAQIPVFVSAFLGGTILLGITAILHKLGP